MKFKFEFNETLFAFKRMVYEILNTQVPVNFFFAYALSKAVRVQRTPLDAALGKVIAEMYPPLATVQASCLIDAAADLIRPVTKTVMRIPLILKTTMSSEKYYEGHRDDSERMSPAAVPAWVSEGAEILRQPRTNVAKQEAKRIADKYGLAYMAAKNIIGPTSIIIIYFALQLVILSLPPFVYIIVIYYFICSSRASIFKACWFHFLG